MSTSPRSSQLFFLSLFAFNHFMPQQQRARSVGTASVASVSEVNIGGCLKMKKVLRSTIGTLVVAAFLAIASPTFARGGHGGGHGGNRGHAGGHAFKGHVAVGHVRGGHAGFVARGGRGHQFARPARGNGRYAARAYNWNGASSLGRRSLVSVLWIFSGWLLRLRLWLSILRKWLLRLPIRWLLSILRELGILPLPIRILAVRDLQLRVRD